MLQLSTLYLATAPDGTGHIYTGHRTAPHHLTHIAACGEVLSATSHPRVLEITTPAPRGWQASHLTRGKTLARWHPDHPAACPACAATQTHHDPPS